MATQKIKVDLLFNANTQQAQAELKKLSDSLQKIQSRPGEGANNFGISKAAEAARLLEQSLKAAVDVNTGKLNLNKFSQSLKSSGQSLEKIYRDLTLVGSEGEIAFRALAKSISLSDASLLSVNDKVKELMKTLKNTARWEISSKVLRGFESAISNAYRYAQDLNKSLNDIRIVTSYNTDQMAKFAKEANKSAKALSTTTTDYTKASLIYYQQGLSDKEVQERTNATVKMANVTGTSAEEVSNQLTAVWNNFADGSKNLEYYADVMTALGAATASSSDEISQGLNKFAATAQTVGLSYEYAASALATVTSTTRESADVVGTAFKTLFARIQDLELGETLDDGTTLGSYSQALAKVGIDIKDTNDEIKTMDTLLTEIAGKWQTMSEDAQTALAESVAGTRQYTQLMALMNNWDFFQENLQTSYASSGTLNEQAEIYAESWEAAQDRVTASAEEMYSKIINDEAFIELTNFFAKLIDFTSDLVDGMGGLEGVLATVGSIFMAKYAKELPQALKNAWGNVKAFTGLAVKDQIENLNKVNDILLGRDRVNGTQSKQKDQLSTADRHIVELNEARAVYLKNKNKMSEAQQKEIDDRFKNIESIQEEIEKYQEIGKEAKKSANERKNALKAGVSDGIAKQQEIAKNKQDAARLNLLELEAEKNKLTKKHVNKRTPEEEQRINELKQEIEQARSLYDKAKEDFENAMLLDPSVIKEEIENAYKVLNDAIANLTRKEAKISTGASNIDFLIKDTDIKEADVFKEKLQEIVGTVGEENFNGNAFDELNKIIDASTSNVEELRAALRKLYIEQQSKGSFFEDTTGEQEAFANAEENLIKKTGNVDSVNKAVGELQRIYGAEVQGESLEANRKDKLNNLNKNVKPGKFDLITSGLGKATSAAMGAVGAFNSVSNSMEILTNESATTEEKLTSLGGTVTSLASTAASMFAAAGPWGLAIMAIVAAGAALYKLYDYMNVSSKEALENAKQHTEELSQASKEAADKTEDLFNKYNEYNTAVEALNACTRGTEEWKAALDDVKAQTDTILETYPELLKMSDAFVYDEATGQYMLDPEKIKEAQKKSEEKQKQLETEYQISQLTTQRAANNLYYEDFKKAHAKIADEYDYQVGDYVTVRDVGYILPELLDKINQGTSDADLMAFLAENVTDEDRSEGKRARESAYQQMITTAKQYAQGLKDLENQTITTSKSLIQGSGISDKSEIYLSALANYVSNWESQYSVQDVVQKIINGTKASGDKIDQEIAEMLSSYATDKGYRQKSNFVSAGDGRSFRFVNENDEKVVVTAAELAEWYRANQINSMLAENGASQKYAKNVEEKYKSLKGNKVKQDFLEAALSYDLDSTTMALGNYFANLTNEITDINTFLAENYEELIANLELGITEAEIVAEYERVQGSLKDKVSSERLQARIQKINRNQRTVLEEDVWNVLKAEGVDDNAFSMNQKQGAANLAGDLANRFSEEIAGIFDGKITAENIDTIMAFQESLQAIDLTAYDAVAQVQTLSQSLSDIISTEDIDNIVEYTESIHQLSNVTTDGAKARASQIKEIVGEGLAYGDILEESDLNKLKTLGLDITEYFDKLSDGTYQLKGGLGNFENGMYSLNKAIIACNKAIKEATLDDYALILEQFDAAIEQGEKERADANNNPNLELNDKQLDLYESLAFLSGFTQESLQAMGLDVDTIGLINSNVTKDENGVFTGAKVQDLNETDVAIIEKAVSQAMDYFTNMQVTYARQAQDYDSLDQMLASGRISKSVYDYVRAEMEAAAEAFELTKFEDIVDIYADIGDELENINRQLERANKEADKLYGSERLSALDKVNKLYLQEIGTLKDKEKIIQDSLKTAKETLETHQINVNGVPQITFDPTTGLITNQYDIQNKLYEAIHAVETQYQNTGASDIALEAERDRLRKEYDIFEDYVSHYEELYRDNEDAKDSIEDAKAAIRSNNYEIFTYKIDLNLELNEMDLSYIDTQMKLIEDDFYAMAEAAFLLDSKRILTQAQGSSGWSDFEELKDLYNNKFIDQKDYVNGLKNQYNTVLSNIEALTDLDKEMLEYYGNTIKMAQEELGKYTDRLEHATSVVDHYKNLMSTLGKEMDYKNMNTVLKGYAETIKNQVDVAKSEYEMYAEQAAAKRKLMNSVSSSDAAYELYKNEWEAAEQAMREAQDNMLSKTAEWAEAMKATIENELAGLGETLEKSLTGGMSFDELGTSMERAASLQEEYLTSTNKIYETTKLMRTAQNAMDATTNSVAKQKLQNYINETKALQDSTKLSKYELDIQQAKYDLLLAEIALQDAQNAKTKVRLTRDAEGNFGYVYTADQNKVNEAQQKFEDAQNKLYNIGLDGANEYVEKYQQTMQQMHDELTSLQTAYLNGEITTQEEYNRRQNEIQAFYYQKLKDYSSLYQVALTTDSRVVADAWSTDFADMTYRTDEWMNNVNDYIGQVEEKFIEWQDVIDEVESNVNVDFTNMETAIGLVTSASKALRDEIVDDVIPAIDDELKEVGKITEAYAPLRSEISQTINEYLALAEAIKAAHAAQVGDLNSYNYEDPEGIIVKPKKEEEEIIEPDNPSKPNSSSKPKLPALPEDPKFTPIYVQDDETLQNNSTKDIEYGYLLTGDRVRSSKLTDTSWNSKEELNKILESDGTQKFYEYQDGKYVEILEDDIKYLYQDGKYHISIHAGESIYLKYPKTPYGPTITQFKTGGYTGAWGPEGKLAILDEKELVLNQNDTANFLASLDLLHDIIGMIDLQAANAQASNSLSMPQFNYSSGSLEQSVHIEASFPGVTDRTEIEEAFNNLVNKASQYANRK